MRVLLVDDEPDFVEALAIGLEACGIESAAAPSGAAAVALLEANPGGHFDLVLLDIQMPEQSGMDLLAALRAAGNEIPVIFVTAIERVDQKVRGLGMGADDYVVKPIEIDEVVARMRAVLRARGALVPLLYGDLELDLARRRVTRAGKPVFLSPREYDILLALVRAKGATLSREALFDAVWGGEVDSSTNLLDVHLGRLRKKLDRFGRPLIHNERGVGYHAVAHRRDDS